MNIQFTSNEKIIPFIGVSVMGDASISFIEYDGNALAVVEEQMFQYF
jgi:hypothetical protein